MKMDYLMRTKEGMVLAEVNERREQESRKRCLGYTGKPVSDSKKEEDQENQPE